MADILEDINSLQGGDYSFARTEFEAGTLKMIYSHPANANDTKTLIIPGVVLDDVVIEN